MTRFFQQGSIIGRRHMLFMAAIVGAGLAIIIVAATVIARAADDARMNEQVNAVAIALAENRALFADAAGRLSADIAALSMSERSGDKAALARALWPTDASALRHEQAFLVTADGRVGFQYPPRPEAGDALPDPVRAFLKDQSRANKTEGLANPSWEHNASGPANAVGVTDFLLLGGEPTLAAAVAVHASDQHDGAGREAILVLLDQIDSRTLSLIARMHNLVGLSYDKHSPDDAHAGLSLTTTSGKSIGWLTWERNNAVSTAFWQASPYFAGLSLALIAIAGFAGVSVDGSNRKLIERERQARHEAAHDALTGLANRAEFSKRLTAKLNEGGFRQVSVLYIDLDGFKEINDTLGHHAGDELLVGVAARVKEVVALSGVVARLGGDEFAVLLPDLGVDQALLTAGRIIRAIQRVMVVQGSTLSIGSSIGIAAAPVHGDEAGDLLRRADIALYAAKRRGRGRAALFDADMERDVHYRRYLERDMRAALFTGEFELAYQPIFATDGVRALGVEALLRWKSPVRGMISPVEFIAIAEETGFIVKLGAWALEKACADAMKWDLRFVSVNLSPVQMRSHEIVDTVAGVLRRTGLAPERLVLEITEGVLIERADEALAVIKALQALGVGIALDDFGSGFSSLAYLTRFPFNKLKMDRTFVETLGRDADAATIVHSIISLGRALGMTVVAEGVETREQHRFLRAAGCHEMQGYLFARPMPAKDLHALLDSRSLVRMSA